MQFIVYPGRAAIFDNIGKRSYWRGFQSKIVLLKKRFPKINLRGNKLVDLSFRTSPEEKSSKWTKEETE